MSRSASQRSLSARNTGGNSANSDDDVLRETRKLLNALNEENAELKSQNDILCEKLRKASDAVSTATSERDSLEQDMKDINFNLMQQLRAKSAALKESEVKLEDVSLRERTAAKDFQRSERQREELESELMILRERLAVSDDTHRKAQRKLDDASTTSEDTKARQKELVAEVSRLRHSLQEAKAERDAVQDAAEAYRREALKQEELTNDEHRTAVDSLSRQIAALTAQASRASRAESEVLFAHGEMSQMASVSYEQLVAFQQHLGGILESVSAADAAHGAQLSRVQELALQLAMVRQHDELVIAYLVDERRSTDEELRALRRTVDHLQSEVSTTTAARDGNATKFDRLENEVKRLEAQVQEQAQALEDATAHAHRVQAKLREAESRMEQDRIASDEARRALSEADAALEISGDTNARLERELAHERTMCGQLKATHSDELNRLRAAHEAACTQLQSDVEALEEDNENLHEQVREHTETLAQALSRLATSGRRSVSHRSYRSMSTDSAPYNATARPQSDRQTVQRLPLHAGDGVYGDGAPAPIEVEHDESAHLSRSIDAAVVKARAVARTR